MNILQFSALLIWLLFCAIVESLSQLRPRVGVRAMSPRKRAWVWLGLVLLIPALLWEFAGAILEYFGYTEFPTYSRIIVGAIPQVILLPLTIIIAIVLCWHWRVTWRNERTKTILLVLGAGALAIVNINQTTIQIYGGSSMLENVTLNQVVVFFLSAGGIAVLLQRIPGWEQWQSKLKPAIVTVLNLVAGFILPGVLKAIPAGYGDQTVAQIVIGLFMAAAAFVIHYADEWLAAQAKAAKLAAK